MHSASPSDGLLDAGRFFSAYAFDALGREERPVDADLLVAVAVQQALSPDLTKGLQCAHSWRRRCAELEWQMPVTSKASHCMPVRSTSRISSVAAGRVRAGRDSRRGWGGRRQKRLDLGPWPVGHAPTAIAADETHRKPPDPMAHEAGDQEIRGVLRKSYRDRPLSARDTNARLTARVLEATRLCGEKPVEAGSHPYRPRLAGRQHGDPEGLRAEKRDDGYHWGSLDGCGCCQGVREVVLNRDARAPEILSAAPSHRYLSAQASPPSHSSISQHSTCQPDLWRN